MSLLTRIKELREKNDNMSINKLEKVAGLTRGSISKWDDHTPSYDKLLKVANYFGVTPEYLLTGVETKKEPISENGDKLTEQQKDAMEFILSLTDEQLKQFIRIGKAMLGE